MSIYFSIFATIIALLIFFGGNAFIEYKIKNEINTKIAKTIDDDAQYLEQRNKITQLRDIAISKGSIPKYEELVTIAQNSSDEKIKQAAEAEVKSVEILYSVEKYFYPVDKLDHKTVNGKTLVGADIPTPILMDMISKSEDIGEITTIIHVLHLRKHEKDIPQNLLKIARDTDHIHVRYSALLAIQKLVFDFTANPYRYKEFEDWWQTTGIKNWRKKK